MSTNPPRKLQSGLGSVQRDISYTSGASEPKSSQEAYYDWVPTQAMSSRSSRDSVEQTLQALEERVAHKPLNNSTSVNKRGSGCLSGLTGVPPTKKPRQLPRGYTDDDINDIKSAQKSTSRYFPPGNNTRSANQSQSTMEATASKGKLAPVFLSQEQSQIKSLAVNDGKSLFYTGSAGTGKSVLLREIIKDLRKRYLKSPDAVAITASTGIAACNIGGVTIHSFAGIGLGIDKAEDLAKRVKMNRKASSRWLRTKVLIIDEISMVEADLFDKLAQVGSIVKKDPLPFGGIQVIVTGDFFQLPPVTRGGQVKFAFEAEFWKQTINHTFNLTKVFRQRDQDFIDMLNEMRFGQLSPKSVQKFKQLARPIRYEDGLEATELFPRREDVDRSNSGRLSRLNTQAEEYAAKDGGSLKDLNQRQKMLANFMAPERIVLRIDSQVMLIKNVDDTLVNGSMGRIVRFVDQATYSKEQGQDVTVLGGNSGMKKPVSTVGGTRYPLVEFLLPNGSMRPCLVMPEVWKVELPDGEVQVSRTQLPLILSWAMSIHKSQGQTLERVKVDLGRVFEKGQAYVALSRATSLDGLQVLNFNPSKVLAHPKVIQWSKTLQTLTDKESKL